MTLVCKIVQNNKNKRTLAAWINGGRFPHAVLIDGSAGSGKKTFAKLMAGALVCSGETKPCGKCPHCVKAEKDIHPDIMVYQGDGGARSFHVDQVRDLREQAYISPNEADRKVFLLFDVENMSVQAQNALLKIIEEPPRNVYFILTTENRNLMLPTIRSRVASMSMEIPDVEVASAYIGEKVGGKTTEQYKTAAVRAGGNIGLAISLLEDSEEDHAYNTAVKVWESLKKGDEISAASLLSGYNRNREEFIEQLEFLKGIVLEELLYLGREKGHNSSEILKRYTIIDIIDDVEKSTNGNVNMLLLVSILPFKIRKALASR